MRKTLLFLLIAAVAPALPGATVSGRVILIQKGTPLSDASNAVVWIENSREAGGVQRRGEMKSENKKFAPRVVVVS